MKKLMMQAAIAEKYGYSLAHIRRLATGPGWPEVEMQIGPCKFYRRRPVMLYFADRQDGRRFNGRRQKKRAA